MRLKRDNVYSAVAGYLSLDVTVIETLFSSVHSPYLGESAQMLSKKGPGPGAFPALPQMRSCQPAGPHLLPFLVRGRHVEHESSVPGAEETGLGWFRKRSSKFPSCGAEGVDGAALEGA